MRICAAVLLSLGCLTGCDDELAAPPPDLAAPPDLQPALDLAQPTSCYASPVQHACGQTAPAPTIDSEVAAFIRGVGLPLRCGERTWDLSGLKELFGDKRVFMMGEVHGTNEIGIISAQIFRMLGEVGLVNVLAMELPMDIEADVQQLVDTGSSANGFSGSFAKNSFGRILPTVARELTLAGHPIRIAAVDVPMGTAMPIEAIQVIAASLVTQQARVLQGLPAPKTFSDQLAPDYVSAAMAYYEALETDKATVCSELSEAKCDELMSNALAVWCAAATFSPGVDQALWFERREQVIYFNFRRKLPADTDRIYAHMGAFHTNKYQTSAGSRLAHQFAPTAGKVFSLSTAFGEGSQIWYQQIMDLPAEPLVITDALVNELSDPIFVATALPNASCAGNPLVDLLDGSNGTPMGGTYDGYVHIRRLTPETKPQTSTITGPPMTSMMVSSGLAVRRNYDRVHELERRYLEQRKALRR